LPGRRGPKRVARENDKQVGQTFFDWTISRSGKNDGLLGRSNSFSIVQKVLHKVLLIIRKEVAKDPVGKTGNWLCVGAYIRSKSIVTPESRQYRRDRNWSPNYQRRTCGGCSPTEKKIWVVANYEREPIARTFLRPKIADEKKEKERGVALSGWEEADHHNGSGGSRNGQNF